MTGFEYTAHFPSLLRFTQEGCWSQSGFPPRGDAHHADAGVATALAALA